jgi:hypothetical protein
MRRDIRPLGSTSGAAFSLDQLIGGGEQRRWDGQAECFGRLEVDD